MTIANVHPYKLEMAKLAVQQGVAERLVDSSLTLIQRGVRDDLVKMLRGEDFSKLLDEEKVDCKYAWENRMESRRSASIMSGRYTLGQDHVLVYALFGCALSPCGSMMMVKKWNDERASSELVEPYEGWYLRSDLTLGQTLMGENWYSYIDEYARMTEVNLNPSNLDVSRKEFKKLELPPFYERFYQHTYKQFIIEHLGSANLLYADLDDLNVLGLMELTPILFRVATVLEGDWDVPETKGYSPIHFRSGREGLLRKNAKDVFGVRLPDENVTEYEIEAYERYLKDKESEYPLLNFSEYLALVELYFVIPYQPFAANSNPLSKILEAYKVLKALGVGGRYVYTPEHEDLSLGSRVTVAGSSLGEEITNANEAMLGKTRGYYGSQLLVSLDYRRMNVNLNDESNLDPMPEISTFFTNKMHTMGIRWGLPAYYVTLEFLGRLNLIWERGIDEVNALKEASGGEVKGRGMVWGERTVAGKKEIGERESTFPDSLREGDFELQLKSLAAGVWDPRLDTLEGRIMDLFSEYDIVDKEEANSSMDRVAKSVYREFWKEELNVSEQMLSGYYDDLTMEDILSLTLIFSHLQDWTSPKGDRLPEGYTKGLKALEEEIMREQGLSPDVNVDEMPELQAESVMVATILTPLLAKVKKERVKAEAIKEKKRELTKESAKKYYKLFDKEYSRETKGRSKGDKETIIRDLELGKNVELADVFASKEDVFYPSLLNYDSEEDSPSYGPNEEEESESDEDISDYTLSKRKTNAFAKEFNSVLRGGVTYNELYGESAEDANRRHEEKVQAIVRRRKEKKREEEEGNK